MTFKEKIRDNYYSTLRTHYPDRKDFTRYYVYQTGETIVCGDKYDVMDALNMDWDRIKSEYTVEEAFDEKVYNNQYKLYYKEADEKECEFRKDAMCDLGYSKLPESIQNKIYDYACNKEHSSGYTEVYNELCDLREIVDEVINFYEKRDIVYDD